MATATQISDQDVARIAAQYSLPPALLSGVIRASGSSDTFGLSDATLLAYRLSPAEIKADPLTALAVSARVLAQSFAQLGTWEAALSQFLTGDPQAYQSPTSAVGGQVESILGAAAIDPMFGLQGFQPADPRAFSAMASSLGAQMSHLTSSGGAVTRQSLQQYTQHVDAISAAGHAQSAYTADPQLQQVAADILSQMSAQSGVNYPATPANLALIATMARGEGMPAQDYNWLASTQGQGVGTVPGTPGVNVYGSYQQGVTETARTFLNGNFDALLGQMRGGADLQTMARDPKVQANLRTWQGGSSEDVNLLLGTRNVPGGVLGSTTIAQGLQAAAQNNAQGYSAGQCTYYAARSLGFIPGGLGNADDWAARASSMGMHVDSTPAVGTAVVYGPGGSYSPQYGHVAVVKQVNPDGTFVVSEMNVDGVNVVDERTSTMQGVIGFIHPPQGTDMTRAAPGLAQQVAATSASTPQQQARQSAAVAAGPGHAGSVRGRMQAREPKPAQVGEFAAQLQGAGIHPQEFVDNFPSFAAAVRRDLQAKVVDVTDYAKARDQVVQAGQPVNQSTLTAAVRSQPHPVYPSVTVGQMADMKGMAMLHSVQHTQQVPTHAEVARLAQAGAGWKEVNDYYQQQAAMRQRAAVGVQTAQPQRPTVLQGGQDQPAQPAQPRPALSEAAAERRDNQIERGSVTA